MTWQAVAARCPLGNAHVVVEELRPTDWRTREARFYRDQPPGTKRYWCRTCGNRWVVFP